MLETVGRAVFVGDNFPDGLDAVHRPRADISEVAALLLTK